MNEEGKLMLEFLSNKFGTSDQKQILKKLSKLDKEQQQALAQEYQLWKAKKKTKAAHGAKLDYVKSLKHICPEGLELVYFKKGGSVKCGCVGKKLEKGDKVEASGAVARFKNAGNIKISAKSMGSSDNSESIVNAISTITQTKAGFDRAKKEKKNKNQEKPVTNVPTLDKNPGSTKQPMQEALERARHKNDYNNLKKGGAVDKFKSAKCGSKMKKHKLGGSLNGIPFYLGGTNKGGVKKEIKLPEYMTKLLIGYPSILPGRYTGLEKMTPGLFLMFKTWVKGLPKTLTPMDYISAGAGAATGIGLGYDDTHNLYVRKWITNTEKSLLPLPLTPSKPFIEFIKK